MVEKTEKQLIMMKKKMTRSEEAKKISNEQTTDNKSNTTGQEENESMVKGDQQPEDKYQEEEGVISQADTTDKVVGLLRASEEKLAELQDKYARLSAEFDNYRKRTLREKMDLVKYSGESMLLKIIPFMDDFDRALLHMDTSTDCVALKDGIDLIYNKFSEFLKQNGVKEIESLNSDFNVDLHEAVAKVPVNEEDKKGKVVDVIQKGYYLQDKVIRFSKVVVGE
jgi:molecular chaperone GrpE